MRLSRCKVRDHITCRKNDPRPSYQFHSALQRLKIANPPTFARFSEPRNFSHNPGRNGSEQHSIKPVRLTRRRNRQHVCMTGARLRAGAAAEPWRSLIRRSKRRIDHTCGKRRPTLFFLIGEQLQKQFVSNHIVHDTGFGEQRSIIG